MVDLVVNIFFKNFRNYRNYRNWPIIVQIRFSTLFENWIGVNLAVFHSLGYIPVRMNLENMAVNEGAILPVAVFNSLLGILLRPVAFLSSLFFKRFYTISMLGVCRENDLSVVSR